MSRGPDRDFWIAVWIVALILLVLVFTAHATKAQASSQAKVSWRDERLNAIASWLAGRPVTVKCLDLQESWDDQVIGVYGASAYVEGRVDERGRWHPLSETVFKVGICERLVNLLDRVPARQWSARSIAWAVLVLTHESGHLKGAPWAGDEAKTECWAIQRVQAVGRRLGIEALWLLQALANDIHRNALSPDYQLRGCRIPNPEVQWASSPGSFGSPGWAWDSLTSSTPWPPRGGTERSP